MAREANDIAIELLGTGLDQRQTALLTELILALSTRQGGAQVESPAGVSAAEKRRAWDRDYRRERRERELMGDDPPTLSTRHPPDIHPIPPDKVETDCNFLSSSKSLERGNRESKKEPSSRIVALANKGTRLSADSKISDEDREFAWTLGLNDEQINQAWAEFVDYWISVPGHRGVKLSWSATWRNRVRAIHERSKNGQHRKNGNGGSGKGFAAYAFRRAGSS